MKSYDELKLKWKQLSSRLFEAKKNKRADALEEVKRFCKEFGFIVGMLKGALAEGGKPKDV